jgi:hypothetical protein
MIIDILQITIPSLILLIAVIYIVKGFLKNQTELINANLLRDSENRKKESELKSIEISKANKEITMPLRLHAYERMTLFCTRMELSNIIRNSGALNTSVKFLSRDLIFNIEDEYKHNITQQMYMTDELWQIILLAKFETISIIQTVTKQTEELHKDTTPEVSDFIRQMDQYLNEHGQEGYLHALNAIKKEVSLLY